MMFTKALNLLNFPSLLYQNVVLLPDGQAISRMAEKGKSAISSVLFLCHFFHCSKDADHRVSSFSC